jgi:hypothetical protein
MGIAVCCDTGEDLQSPAKKLLCRKARAHGDEHLANEGTRNARNQAACTGRLEKPGPKTLDTQGILEQTKTLLLSRTNAYGDGCFRAASKRGPSGSIEVPRFVPIPLPCL